MKEFNITFWRYGWHTDATMNANSVEEAIRLVQDVFDLHNDISGADIYDTDGKQVAELTNKNYIY